MISIIIPLYNQAKKLEKCLQSIKKQTYNNYEIIIVNDRSIDHLSKIFKQAKKDFGINIEYIHNSVNHGAPYSRNKGLRRSKGEFLLFCDADVVLKEDALKIMLEELKSHPEASFVYPSHRYGKKLFKLWPFDPEKLKQMPYIHSTALVRREHLPHPAWDESLRRLQDWDLWLTMLEKGYKGHWIDKVLFTIKPGGVYSAWMPSFFYKLFPFLPKVRAYKKAVEVVKKKHGIEL